MTEIPPIASRRNPIIQQFRRVRDGAEEGLFIAEGLRFLEEAARAKATIDVTLVSRSAMRNDRCAALVKALTNGGSDLRVVEDDVMDAVTATRASQGIAAIAKRTPSQIQEIFVKKDGFVVIAAGVSDPGNLGTLLRTADAAGATGFVVTRDSVSPWNDKALRASAGSIFHIPVAVNVKFTDVAAAARARKYQLATTAASSGEIYHKTALRPPIVLVLGNEGSGVADGVAENCDITIRIPISKRVESLNVASAGAILCFEIARQAATSS